MDGWSGGWSGGCEWVEWMEWMDGWMVMMSE